MTPWDHKRDYAEIAKAVAAALAASDVSKPAVLREWKCNRADCLFAVKGWSNWSGRTHCQGCYKPKQAAMSPPPAERLKPHVDPKAQTAVKKKEEMEAIQKKKEARLKRNQARRERKAQAVTGSQSPVAKDPAPRTVAAIPKPGSIAAAVAPLDSVADPTPSTRLTLPAELVDKIPLLLKAATTAIAESLTSELIPCAVECKTPEALLNRFIGEKGPTAKVAKKEALEADIVKLKLSLEPLKDSESMADMAESIQAKIDAAEATLTKLLKDAPSVGFELKSVLEAKSSFEVWSQARVDKEVRGAAKAAERRLARHQHIEDLKAQLTLLENGLTELEDRNTAKHAEKGKALADLDANVAKLFDAKIKQLKTPPSTAESAAASAISAGNQLAIAAGVPVPQSGVPAPRTLKEMEAHIADLTTKFQQAIAVKQEFERTLEIAVEDLPKAKQPDPSAVSSYNELYLALHSWVGTGSALPFEWAALAGLGQESDHPAFVCKLLLGNAWSKWYPDGDPPAAAVVPRQVATMVFGLLCNLKLELDDQEEKKLSAKRAEDCYVAVSASGKRLRTSSPGPAA